jgi:predicted nucleotidyltransferase
MKSEKVLNTIRSSLPRLQELGVSSVAVFGSATRDELKPDSDVDILIDFEGAATFDKYMETKFFLEKILERPVDLVTPRALKPRMRPSIEKEAIYVT